MRQVDYNAHESHGTLVGHLRGLHGHDERTIAGAPFHRLQEIHVTDHAEDPPQHQHNVVPEGLRSCDECGRITEAGEFPDWPGGVCEVCDPSVADTVVDLEHVCRLLAAEGIPAYVEQTGGGVATIYAGQPREDEDRGHRYPVIAGPGWFEGPDWTEGRADTRELYVGPDDDGEVTPTAIAPGTKEDEIAAVIAKQVREHQEGQP